MVPSRQLIQNGDVGPRALGDTAGVCAALGGTDARSFQHCTGVLTLATTSAEVYLILF